MSQCVIDSLPFLKLLGSCSKKLLRQVIHEADTDLLNALHEVLVNVDEGNVALTQTARFQLRKRRNTFKKLLRNLKAVSSKRNKFKQYGPVIFPIVLPSAVQWLQNQSK